MNSLRACVHEYLAMRRALGFKLKKYEGWLLDFVTFMGRRRAVRITVRLALTWAEQTKSVDQNYRAQRLRVVRGFASYRSAIDPRTEIPQPDLLPREKRRLQPYLYTEDEIKRILVACLQRRRGATPISRWTRFTLFGLLSVTGMDLLHAGIEQSMIALWLGHESIETTQIYLDADLALKEKILAKTTPIDSKPGKFRPDNRLLTFLNQL